LRGGDLSKTIPVAETSNPTILVDVHEKQSSIEQVVGADEEGLHRVPGVGPERARALLETLRSRHARPHQ
jgi:ERCC4-type nuclease